MRPGRHQPAPRRAAADSAARVCRDGRGEPRHRAAGAHRRRARAHAAARARRPPRCSQAVGAAVKAGITTDELDRIATRRASQRGGYPSPLQLQGLPEVAVHVGQRGHLPRHPRQPRAARRRHRQLRRHDLPPRRARRHATPRSSSATSTTESRRLVQVTRECLRKGIDEVKPGRPHQRDRPRDRGRTPTAHGFGVVRAFVGHGIGEEFHTALPVPHYYDAARRHRARARA